MSITDPSGIAVARNEYDDDGRLIATIEAVGNRTEKSENSDITKYVYNSRNQLTEEESEAGTVVYSYDANGNLLSQSGAGKDMTYTYDVYNRLIRYAEGDKKESYAYDAEGVRRSKANGEDTIYFISDTTSNLSYTLAETDTEGNAIASYTRVDVLISQNRADNESYYLFDGHGDVRGLLDEEGAVTDTYRYNAYGELIEKTGDTENHFLYTGEYYDGTSNLYYLRARYMNPSTGTFISMDTYEGSIYDPDTLHKYLYANGNPVKYNDPSGHMFGSFVAMTIQTTINNFPKLHVMGVISGVASSAITTFLGGNTDDAINSFIAGYIGGFGMGAILCVAAAYSVVVYAKMLLMMSAANVAMTVTMMVYSIIEKKEKETLVYGTLAILSLFGLYHAYKLNCTFNVMGDKGSSTIKFDNSNPDNPTIDGQSVGPEKADTYDLIPTHSQTKSNRQMNKLISEIKENGITEPIKYVEHNGVKYVVDGHHRLIAAKKLKILIVPVEKVQLPYSGYKNLNDLFWFDE